VQLFGEAPAAQQAHPAEAHIEIGQYAPPRETKAPLLDVIELADRIAPADDRAERCAGDDVGCVPLGDQRADHADMRKSARRAPAERQSDGRAKRGGLSHDNRPHRLIAVLAVAAEKMQHGPFVLSWPQSSARAFRHANISRWYGEGSSGEIGLAKR